MGFNLDFSGWKDARQAQAQSIINQANIAANVIANKYNMYNKMISGLTGAAALGYDKYLKRKDTEAAEEALAMTRNSNTGLSYDAGIDPMQALSASNNLTSDKQRDRERAALIKELMETY